EFVTLQDQYTIIANALRLSNDPALGLKMGIKLQLASHGPVGVAAFSSATAKEAVSTMIKYQHLRGQFVELSSHDMGTHFAFRATMRVPLDEVGMFLIEAMMGAMYSSLEFMIGSQAEDSEIHFAYPKPAHSAVYEQLFAIPMRFDCPYNEMLVPRRYENTPMTLHDPVVRDLALQQCELMSKNMLQRQSITSQINGILRDNQGLLWSLEEMARSLNMSSRTLIRKLKAEGTTYQSLVDEEHKRLAQLYLGTHRHTVESVAAALGYKDASSFRRAFKRWFGALPSEFNERRK
ncbi:MAG TPA: AraC family transcriptional regulator, partial [Pseudomonadales bacterium]|nr:AraC family transcriptional regulator [Pseudomonadales bacterium]